MMPEWSWARRLFRSRNLLTLHKDFQESPKSTELQGYFISVVQLTDVLFWSHGRAWGGVCSAASVLPSLKAEGYLGPARAGSGEQDFSCPLGMAFLTIGILSLGKPSILHPLLTQTQPKREGAACDTPLAGKAWEWHLDLIIQLTFSACLNFDCTGWAGCVFPWNKVLHPSWESAGSPQEQSLGWARGSVWKGSVPEQRWPGEDWEVLVLQEMMQIVLLLRSCFRAWCGGFCFWTVEALVIASQKSQLSWSKNTLLKAAGKYLNTQKYISWRKYCISACA